VLVVICRRCDRGHRYCGHLCALQARRQSTRRASGRYQSGRMGARRHAARQCRYRERRTKQEVTHQGSAAVAIAPMLAADDNDYTAFLRRGLRPCCICGRLCGPRVRTERLALCRSRQRPRWREPPR